MDGGALSAVLAITATHRAHAWDVCVAVGALAAFAPVWRRKREAAIVAVGLAGAAIGATALPMLLRLPAVIATRSIGPLLVGDRMAIGALLGFAGAVAIFARGAGRARMLDAIAPSLGVIVIFGRVGCFLEGCDFGAPSSVPWAVRYPADSHAFGRELAQGLVRATDGASLAVHPAQLYEALVGAAMIAVVLAARRARRRAQVSLDGAAHAWAARDGAIFRAAIATYAAGRFVVELFRGDERGSLGPLSMPQWMAIALLAWCAAGLAGAGRSSIAPDV